MHLPSQFESETSTLAQTESLADLDDGSDTSSIAESLRTIDDQSLHESDGATVVDNHSMYDYDDDAKATDLEAKPKTLDELWLSYKTELIMIYEKFNQE